MKICFIADMTSIHTQKWVKPFAQSKEFEIFIISTERYVDRVFYNAQVFNLKEKKAVKNSLRQQSRIRNSFCPSLIKYYFEILCFSQTIKVDILLLKNYFMHKNKCIALIQQIRPDLIHCLRIPIEGFLGAAYRRKIKDFNVKLIVSTWGNDFTYHSKRNPISKYLTLQVIKETDLLFSDCLRDVRIAKRLGYDGRCVVLPGAMGIERSELEQAYCVEGCGKLDFWDKNNIKIQAHTLIFFFIRGINFTTDCICVAKAFRQVKGAFKLIFIESNKVYGERLKCYLKEYKLVEKSHFIETIPYPFVKQYIYNSDFVVSSTPHDGLPNSLLETMAYGAIPICSNLESIREWIQDRKNGYLFDVKSSPFKIAQVFQTAIDELPKRKSEIINFNRRMIMERAIYEDNFLIAKSYYGDI